MNLCEWGASIDRFLPCYQGTSIDCVRFMADAHATWPGIQVNERSASLALPYELCSHRSAYPNIFCQSNVFVLHPRPNLFSEVSIVVEFMFSVQRIQPSGQRYT